MSDIRNKRRLPRPRVLNRAPLRSEGVSGDIFITKFNNKSYLSIKDSNTWKKVSLDDNFEERIFSLEKINKQSNRVWPFVYDGTDFTINVTGGITLDAAGDIALSADGDQVTMDDGQGNTRFTFNLDTSPEIDVTCGAAQSFRLDINGGCTIESAGPVTIDSTSDIFLDAAGGCVDFKDYGTQFAQIDSGGGGGTLYLYDDASTSDYIRIHAMESGVGAISTVDSNGTLAHLTISPNGDLILDPDSHIIQVLDNTVGFTQTEPVFNATDTIVDFADTGNKQKLTLTNNVTDVHFRFPAMSGNFICVLLQDGTGGRTVSNWKSNSSDGTERTLLWAGGISPSNTETADKADIASFYWDADNNIAYGTYTYKF